MNQNQIIFDKYQVIEELGKGGAGHVYLVRHLKLQNLWAVKQILKSPKDMTTHKSNTELRTDQEYKLLKDLNHPSIPKIIDIEEDDDHLYIVEEYVEGITLKAYKVREKHVTEDEVINWMLQMCDVLGYLHAFHEAPIIYRDIKPDNILIMPQGKIKLIDFGIARKFNPHESQDTVVMGTKAYAPPEQYGMRQSDARTDIFALGVTMYDLLTGLNLSHPPYKIQPIRQLNKDISITLEQIIQKCTMTLPTKRYADIKELKAALEALVVMRIQPISKGFDQLFKGTKIGVFGTIPRIGVTHFVLMLGKVLSEMGNKSTALLEWHEHRDFGSIEKHQDECQSFKDYFEFQKMDFYPEFMNQIRKLEIPKCYDWIIVDGGYLEQPDLELFSHFDRCFIVSGGKDWEFDRFEEFLYNGARSEDTYLFNFINKQSQAQIEESISPMRCIEMGFEPDPFDISEKTRQQLLRLFSIETQKVKRPWEKLWREKVR